MQKISLTSQISAQQNAIAMIRKSSALRPAEQTLLIEHLNAALTTLLFIQKNLVAIRSMLSEGKQ